MKAKRITTQITNVIVMEDEATFQVTLKSGIADHVHRAGSIDIIGLMHSVMKAIIQEGDTNPLSRFPELPALKEVKTKRKVSQETIARRIATRANNKLKAKFNANAA